MQINAALPRVVATRDTGTVSQTSDAELLKSIAHSDKRAAATGSVLLTASGRRLNGNICRVRARERRGTS